MASVGSRVAFFEKLAGSPSAQKFQSPQGPDALRPQAAVSPGHVQHTVSRLLLIKETTPEKCPRMSMAAVVEQGKVQTSVQKLLSPETPGLARSSQHRGPVVAGEGKVQSSVERFSAQESPDSVGPRALKKQRLDPGIKQDLSTAMQEESSTSQASEAVAENCAEVQERVVEHNHDQGAHQDVKGSAVQDLPSSSALGPCEDAGGLPHEEVQACDCRNSEDPGEENCQHEKQCQDENVESVQTEEVPDKAAEEAANSFSTDPEPVDVEDDTVSDLKTLKTPARGICLPNNDDDDNVPQTPAGEPPGDSSLEAQTPACEPPAEVIPGHGSITGCSSETPPGEPPVQILEFSAGEATKEQATGRLPFTRSLDPSTRSGKKRSRPDDEI